MLANSLIIGSISSIAPRNVKVVNLPEKRAYLWQALLFFGFVILLIGLRSGIADTSSYIQSFRIVPNSIFHINLKSVLKDQGFYIVQVIFKHFLSEDYHIWLLFISIISGISVMVPLYKYSPAFGLSIFMFIASANFTYMLNGIRQFIAVSILFYFSYLIINRKTFFYIIIAIIMSTIHGSALLLIPAYFYAILTPWSKKVYITIIIIFFISLFLINNPTILAKLLGFTQYDSYLNNIVSSGKGSNILRVFIAMIPPLLAFINREKIKKLASPIINISINMSIMNLIIMIISTYTSGLIIGRLSIYFDLYNLLLLPWLLTKVFHKSNKALLVTFFFLFYIAFFYYQVDKTFKLYYMSDVLDLYFFN